IGVIDSGCDNSHPLLRHITHGKDFTSGGTDTSWSQDLVAHGTHCAGIINAASTEQGIVGCAPGAELHVFKVMPHGWISDLLAALHECIERELDLIHISVASDGFSELVAQKLREARLKGIACIAAAGNTGGPVTFPAMLPATMAVAAVGRLREFPSDSSHILSVLPHLIGSADVFGARFAQPRHGGAGVPYLPRIPGSHGLVMGLAAADGVERIAMPQYWPGPIQGWPAWLQPPTSGFF